MPKVTGTITKSEPKKKNGNGSKATTQNGKATKKAEPEKKEIVYPRLEIKVFCRDSKRCPEGSKPEGMTAQTMKEILGWQDEDDYASSLKAKLSEPEFKQANLKFGDDFLFLDRYGKKVRLMNNLNNRPFDPRTAEDWMLEILREKWKLNGESMIVDEFASCQDLQHRGVGLIWAVQEWEKDNILPELERQWGVWKTAPEIDCIVVLGVEGSDEVINTINTGKPRTFADALFRSQTFMASPKEERARLSKITSNAVSFLWKRSDTDRLASLAPRRPHSESFEFLDNHHKIIDCAKFILAEGDGKKLTPYLSLGYAAALLYMMGSAASDIEKYAEGGCKEAALDWKLWEKAQEFWVLFCAKSAAMEPLAEELNRLPIELTSIEFKVALFVKAWSLWSNKKKLTRDNLELETKEENGMTELAEYPRIGGIDIDREEPEETGEEEEASPGESFDAMALRGTCPKLTTDKKNPQPHEFITEEGETFCKHCYDPSPKIGKKKGGKK